MENIKEIKNYSDTVMRTILLLSLLKNKKYTASELAEILDCSARQTHRLINGLRAAGINVKTEQGRYGGFKINDNRFNVTEGFYLDILRKLKND